MNDQASSLRRIVGESTTTSDSNRVKVLCITSGKGGVGKTNISINLSIALASMGRNVFLLDADLGLANIDVLLNLTPMYTLEHVLSGEKSINDIILDGPGDIKILPASSGVVEMTEMDRDQQVHLFRKLGEIEKEIDYLVIDTGAGIAPHGDEATEKVEEALKGEHPRDRTELKDANTRGIGETMERTDGRSALGRVGRRLVG